MEFHKVTDREVAMLMAARSMRPGKLQVFLDEFMLGDDNVIEVTWEENEYRSTQSAVASLHSAIKRAHVGARVSLRNGRVFLIKTLG